MLPLRATRSAEEEFDLRAENYAARIGLWEVEKHFFDKYVNKGSKILEIGCGAGRTAIPLAKMGFDVTGIDISSRMISFAKENAKKFNVYDRTHFIRADASDLPFKNSSFDVVFVPYASLDYIYPIERRNNAINEISRVIKKNGILIHSFHNVFSLRGRFGFWFWTPYVVFYWLIKLPIDGGYFVNGKTHEFLTTIRSEINRFEKVGFIHLENKFGKKLKKEGLMKFRRGFVVSAFKKL